MKRQRRQLEQQMTGTQFPDDDGKRLLQCVCINMHIYIYYNYIYVCVYVYVCIYVRIGIRTDVHIYMQHMTISVSKN